LCRGNSRRPRGHIEKRLLFPNSELRTLAVNILWVINQSARWEMSWLVLTRHFLARKARFRALTLPEIYHTEACQSADSSTACKVIHFYV